MMFRLSMRRWLVSISGIVALLLPVPGAAQQAATDRPLLDVLRDTGATRQGLPVYAEHPEAKRYAAALARGLSGRLLRLYALEQRYLQVKTGSRPEPAYLLVSNHMGGFPRFGFFLGTEDKRTAGYVDLPTARRIGGSFGATDQIFPHELGHVILVQLAGPPRHGGSNQLHAIGVRTDPCNAFSEGFAEHFQVMAADDPDALPETRAVVADPFFERRATMQFREYAQEMESRWPVPGRRRVAFPLWFSGAEQTLRYYAVKGNAFARYAPVPARLLGTDPYAAYLLDNLLPGAPADPPKNAAQMVSTEGVVAAFFVAWVTDPRLERARPEPAFYEPFGAAADRLTPLEHAYLKIFHAMFVSRPSDVREMIAGYKAAFPDEAADLDEVVRTVSLGRSFAPVPAVWLANDEFRVGTSLFDQYRALPRVHTFDLNAASVADLVAVPGVNRDLADRIRRGAPFRTVEDLRRVTGVDASLLTRFRALEARATAMRADAAEEESRLSLGAILRPYLVRAAVLVLIAGLLGAAAYRLAVARSWWRAIVNGILAASLGFLLEIALDLPAGLLAAVAAPLLLGLPAALYCLLFPRRTARVLAAQRPRQPVPGRGRLALAVLFAWVLASLPLALLMTPRF